MLIGSIIGLAILVQTAANATGDDKQPSAKVARLRGHVTDQAGEPIEGARVRIALEKVDMRFAFPGSGHKQQETVTNKNGQYLFDGLPLDSYLVEVDTTTLPTGFNTTSTYDPDGTGKAQKSDVR